MTDYYAAPTVQGTGDGLSAGNARLIASNWGDLNDNDTLYLADGEYTGSNSMIQPSGSLSGSSGNPITIKATNAGLARINGQGLYIPLHFINCDWLIVEDINFHNSIGSVVQLYQSDNNIIRRCCGWDVPQDHNGTVFTVSHSSTNLWEDCAAFGNGRKMFSNSQEGNALTMRRCWAQFRGTTRTSPAVGISTGYNADNCIAENCISTWDAPIAQIQPFAPWRTGGGDVDDDLVFSKVYGCIGYIRAVDRNPPGQMILVSRSGQVEYKDCVMYIEPGSHTGVKRWQMGTFNVGTPTNNQASKMTGIGGTAGFFHANWTTDDIVEGANLAAIYGGSDSVFVPGASGGAALCTQYVDGILTGTKLWPWPMNQRIIDAMTTAGYTPVDVTAQIETMFGEIPAACSTVVPPQVIAPIAANIDLDILVDEVKLIDVVASVDANGQTIDATTVAVPSAPPNGTITAINGTTGVITYTPDVLYQGEDSFTYTVDDTDGDTSNAATVTIMVGAIRTIKGIRTRSAVVRAHHKIRNRRRGLTS